MAELVPLGFAKSSFCFAVPKDSALTGADFHGNRIATSYPNLVCDHLILGLTARIIRLDGAVEISVQLGVADAIADVVQSGRTLEQAGLRIVGQPLVRSEAVLIGRSESILENPRRDAYQRIQGIVVASQYAMIEYDCPKAVAEQASAITPGIESPTIAPLHEPDWIAIKSMVKGREVNAASWTSSRRWGPRGSSSPRSAPAGSDAQRDTALRLPRGGRAMQSIRFSRAKPPPATLRQGD